MIPYPARVVAESALLSILVFNAVASCASPTSFNPANVPRLEVVVSSLEILPARALSASSIYCLTVFSPTSPTLFVILVSAFVPASLIASCLAVAILLFKSVLAVSIKPSTSVVVL